MPTIVLIWPSGKPVEANEITPGSTIEFDVATGKIIRVNLPPRRRKLTASSRASRKAWRSRKRQKAARKQ